MSKTMPTKIMKLIVAMDIDCGIGKGGTIPWSLRKDMAYFLEHTTYVNDKSKRNAVLMGRKCYESIPLKFRPLKNRLNIVISRSLPASRSDDLIVTPDFDGIWKELTSGSLADGIETVWNIGGSEIYRLALEKNLVDVVHVTKIASSFDADVKIDINWEDFVEDTSKKSDIITEKDIQFVFHVYNRLSNDIVTSSS